MYFIGFKVVMKPRDIVCGGKYLKEDIRKDTKSLEDSSACEYFGWVHVMRFWGNKRNTRSVL